MGNKVEITGVNTSTLPKLNGKQLAELMEKVKTGDKLARNEFAYANMRLVLSVVQRFNTPKENMDDIFQVGCIGLMKAIDNFDVSLNVKFSTYAVPMIIGEIKRFLRDDGSIKVSRSIKGQYYSIQKFIDEYYSEHQKKPDITEIANQFKIDENELMFVMESSKMPISIYDSLDKDTNSSHIVLDKLPEIRDEQNDMINKMLIKDVISKLDNKDKKLIILRYFRDMTQSEVAKVLGVSQVQISRIESKVIGKMRKQLA